MAQSTVRLIVDAQNAIRPLQQTNAATLTLSKNTNKLKNNLNGSNRALSSTGPAAARSAGGVRTLTSALGPLLKALALIGAARFVFVQSAEIETQTKSLEVLTGSLTKTKQIIEELQAFGSVTPFTSSELIEQTKRLKAFGFETEKLVDTTKRISDIAGATGADLAGIATAFGQIQAKGKLQQEENLQLLERGVNITDELQKITGKFGDEFADAMRQGEIGADLVNQALINLTNEGGAFFGGATAQATTLNGKLSTLVDTVQSLARTIGKILGPTIKFILDQTTRAVQAIDNLLKRFQNIGKIGFGNVLGAENKAQKDAAKLTTTKFGDDALDRNLIGGFKNKEAGEFFEKQKKALIDANIQTEKLRQKDFEHNQEKTEGLVQINTKLKEKLELEKKSSAELDKQKEKAKKLKEKMTAVGEQIESSIKNNLKGAITGAQSFGEAMSNVLNSIRDKLLDKALDNLFGGFGEAFGAGATGGGGGGIGGFIGKIFGGLFANGGQPPVGRPSIVGERGPELFVPRSAGTIVPNEKIGGSNITNNISINVDATNSNVQSDNDGQQFGQALASAIQAEIVKQKRSGGLLR